MKIGFVGNANNYPFGLARAMRKLGHEVCFVVTTDRTLDRPEHRYADVGTPYPEWIEEVELANPLDWIRPAGHASRKRIVRLMASCRFVIANQLGCSLLPGIRRPALSILTGTDLLVYCQPATASRQAAGVVSRNRLRRSVRSWVTHIQYRELIRRQRAGIRQSAAVSFFPRGIFPAGDDLLDEIGVTASRRIFVQMTDVDDIRQCRPPSNAIPRLFCGTRLNWVRPIPEGLNEIDYKGADILIRGLGLYFRRTGRRVDLRLVRKGLDIEQTLGLLDAEGIGDQVTWCDELDQQRFLDECRKADVVIDQLGNSICGMVTLDAMALGRPVIGNGRGNEVGGRWGLDNPLCQASDAEQVCMQLDRLLADASSRQVVGDDSRRFVERNFSTTITAAHCLQRLETAAPIRHGETT